jgi:mannose-6-phosphate isomerase-like protein (cupin superfamily)
MADAESTPTKFSRTDLCGNERPRCRIIMPAGQGGRSEPALFEWELTAESWTDQHPHSEYNFVIEGELYVESGGVTLEARTGDVVRVPAGAVGKYWAPKYARLLAIYGPSKGGPSRTLGYEKLSSG